MTNSIHILGCALAATLLSTARGQVTVTVSTDAGGSQQIELLPENSFGSLESAETFVFLDGMQVQVTVVTCALATGHLTTSATVFNVSGQTREVELTVTQAPAPHAGPSLVRSTAAAIGTVVHTGGSIGPVAAAPLVRVRLDGSEVATAIPAPFGFASTSSMSTAIGVEDDLTEALVAVGLAELEQVIAFTISDGAALSVTTQARVRRAGTPDLDGDGVVDGADLGALLDAWGSVTEWAPGDLDGNGAVDGADLGLLLNAFGSVLGCP